MDEKAFVATIYPMNSPQKKLKYAAVGTGGRIPMFIDPIAGRYKDSAELVGLCDSSATRRTFHQQRLAKEYGIGLIPTYDAADFDKMLNEQKPDVVIVCTPDYLHAEYIVRSLEFGADAISEKPLTTDAEKCRSIFEAIEKTGRNVRTTFNYRWSPGVSKVRELIQAGEIGRVKHVDFEYLLDTSHGADYFRRWHSQKQFSGGLLVHKSTHHFDLINWWIDGIPSLVFAMGDLAFYGKKNAIERGQKAWTQYGRYADAPAGSDDPFLLDIEKDTTLNALYRKAEGDSGYVRDQNVFRDGITIEDSLSVMIKYRNGTLVNYSLNAFCPYEGYRVSVTGDAGRIEYGETHASHIITGDQLLKTDPNAKHGMHLRVQKLFADAYDIPIVQAEGGHGGGDPLIQEQIFSLAPPVDKLHRNAGHEQGAASLLVGAAANQSIASGKPVKIDDLVKLNPQATRLSELI